MPVPDFQSFFMPVLNRMADGGEHPTTELRESIAADLKLSQEDIAEKLPSGAQTVFANRVAWACVYLMKAGALERPKRAVFRITSRGRELLGLNLARLTVQHLYRYPEFLAFHKGQRAGTVAGHAQEPKEERDQTPEEQLADAYKVLRESLANDLLETVKSASPRFFEELVVDLLVAMGYGGSVEDAGKAVGKSGDGGVDGIIKEDKLGLDVVYVQAKRWSDSVGRPVVQAFAGSLEGFRARKGVLITTSYFSRDAMEYVRMIEKRIVLIDGSQLADLMIDHDIGVNTTHTYKIKRLDSDYFEES
ncbi:MAG: restriction endonuclease [Acidobacteria bacterium]|nr:restriction endonuclease [Acidobacteriota bacterium]